ncbi:MAG: glycosyltransferase family 4 protein [Ferruginibacter sp.]
MVIVSTSYFNTGSCTDPLQWLQRIRFYTGILDALATSHTVYSIEQIGYSGKLVRNDVKYHFLNFGKKKIYWPAKLHRHIRSLQPDLVLVNGFIFPGQVWLLRKKLGPRARIYLFYRGEQPPGGWRKILHRKAARAINGYFFSAAPQGLQWVQSGCIPDSRKIHEVIQASSFFRPGSKTVARKKLALPEGLLFLWVGRLDNNKDPLTVVKAFIQYLETGSAARLYLIYQEDHLFPEIQKLISASPLAQEAVIPLGRLAHEELEDWYRAADFFISGSHHEGNGIAVCEAMSCGCIPVLTRIPSFTKMTGNGECSLLYEAGNVQALLAVLLKIRELHIEHESKKALKYFSEELSFEAIAEKINAITAPTPE